MEQRKQANVGWFNPISFLGVMAMTKGFLWSANAYEPMELLSQVASLDLVCQIVEFI